MFPSRALHPPPQIKNKSKRQQRRNLNSPILAPAPVRPRNTHRGLRDSISAFSADQSSDSTPRAGQGPPLHVRVAAEPGPQQEASASVGSQPPPAVLVSCLLPLGLANQPAGVSKAPRAPNFPQDGSRQAEPGCGDRPVGALPFKPQTTHIPILSLDTRAEVMLHDKGRGAGRGATVPSPLPAGAAIGMRAAGLWRRGMSVLLGGPGRMRGLRTQPRLLGRRGALGSCPLRHTRLSTVSFREQT